MITCKPSDYLTISLIPEKGNECSLAEFLDIFMNALHLTEMLPMMKFMCSTARYEQILRYEDIQVKIPYEHNYQKQGICVELSGNGVNYYSEYLRNKYNSNLRRAVIRFICLARKGFKPNCSRFDVAFDEQIFNSGETKYLDLDVILKTLEERRFVSHFRKGDPDRHKTEITPVINDISDIDDSLPFDFISSMNLSSGRVGKTIQLGKRSSSSLIRFYDKFAEQEVKGCELPSGCSSWVRCEYEAKKNNANSLLLQFARLPEKEFTVYCAGVLLNLIRFIELDRSRKYNCSVCDWWVGFLQHAKAAKLVHHKPRYNKYVRALAHQKKQNAASLWALVNCDFRNLESILRQGASRVSTSTASAIYDDYNAFKRLSDEEKGYVFEKTLKPVSAVEFLASFDEEGSKDKITKWLDEIYVDVFPEEPEEVTV